MLEFDDITKNMKKCRVTPCNKHTRSTEHEQLMPESCAKWKKHAWSYHSWKWQGKCMVTGKMAVKMATFWIMVKMPIKSTFLVTSNEPAEQRKNCLLNQEIMLNDMWRSGWSNIETWCSINDTNIIAFIVEFFILHYLHCFAKYFLTGLIFFYLWLNRNIQEVMLV